MFHPTFSIKQEDVRLSATAPIQVQDVSLSEKEVLPHDHEFYEIALILSGEAQHQTELGERRVRAGSLIVVHPGQVHAYQRVHQLRLFNTYYLSEWLLRDIHLAEEAPELTMQFLGQALFPERVSPHPLEVDLDTVNFDATRTELEESLQLGRKGENTALLQRAILLKCFARWQGAIQRLQPKLTPFLTHPLVQHVVAQVEGSIRNGEPSSVAAWAEAYPCSADHLSRTFKSLTGEVPSAYYQRRRLQHAVLAIIHSQHTLSEIAHRYGFADSAHFSHQFRAAYGLTPRHYRQRFLVK